MFHAMHRVPGLPTAITLAASWSIATCCLAATEASAIKIAAPMLAVATTSEFGFQFDAAEFAELTLGAPAPGEWAGRGDGAS